MKGITTNKGSGGNKIHLNKNSKYSHKLNIMDYVDGFISVIKSNIVIARGKVSDRIVTRIQRV